MSFVCDGTAVRAHSVNMRLKQALIARLTMFIHCSQKFKEQFENTSDLTVKKKKNLLDIYTNVDRTVSQERKDATSFNGNKSF